MFVLVEKAEVYDPEPLGKRAILIVDEKIQKVGSVDARHSSGSTSTSKS